MVIPLVCPAASIISLSSRSAAPITSQTDTTDPEIIALHVAAENVLVGVLHLLYATDSMTACSSVLPIKSKDC